MEAYKKGIEYGLYSKGQFLNPTGNSTHQQEKDRECFYTLCPLFLTSTAFVVQMHVVKYFALQNVK